MNVLLDSEAIWESFITTDFVRKIVTPFLVVEFDWVFLARLSSFGFCRIYPAWDGSTANGY